MKCPLCGGKGYYQELFEYWPTPCFCEEGDILIETKIKKVTQKIDESEYIMDKKMILTICDLALDMNDINLFNEYSSLLVGLDLGN